MEGGSEGGAQGNKTANYSITLVVSDRHGARPTVATATAVYFAAKMAFCQRRQQTTCKYREYWLVQVDSRPEIDVFDMPF